MTWVKLSDDWYENGKFQAVSCLAELLYIRCLTWSARNLTDGFVPATTVGRLAPEHMGDPMTQGHLDDVRYAMGHLAGELVGVGLWEEHNGGYAIHDFLKFQRSKEQVFEDRRKDAARKRTADTGQSK
jgi:hypothetical protein